MAEHQALEPITQEDWENYFDLRWRVLRQPWNQPIGTEQDEMERGSVHRMVKADDKIVGVGRLHFMGQYQMARIRYMAVDPDYERQGIARAILQSLEQAAAKNEVIVVELNSRESAVEFYQKQGYSILEPSHTLYGEIPHFLMQKNL